MWIVLNNAFLSVVAHRQRPDDLLVRARLPEDISRVFPEAAVVITPHADYRYRAVISRDAVAKALGEQARTIQYGNFKSSVHEPDRHDAYFSIWGVMHRLQPSPL